MFKRMCLSVFVALLVPMFFSSFGEAAHFNVITNSSSWYFGQRGAGVLEEVSEGPPFQETTSGQLAPTYGGEDIVSAYGGDYIQGYWSQTELYHGFSIAHGATGNDQSFVQIGQSACVLANYTCLDYESSITHMQITDDGWGTYGAYADSTVVQAMQIEADEEESVGDPVIVTVSSRYWWNPNLWPIDGWIQGIISGPAGTSGFTVYRKDSNGNILETYAYDPVTLSEINDSSPTVGDTLWDLTIDAAVGDIIEVDSAIFSKIYLDKDEGFDEWYYWGGQAELYLDTQVDVASSPVPIPAAAWLLGSGLVGLVAMRRKPGKV